MNKEELYKKNQRTIKILQISNPFIFWGLMIIAIVLILTAFGQGMDNINEIYNMLDSKVYNDTQLAENYQYLIEKYGELVVGTGTSGFTIHFVNFKGAIFNGLVVALVIVGEVLFIASFVVGKWLVPYFIKKKEQENQDMVNLTILKNDKE